jgi:hypothetical protein
MRILKIQGNEQGCKNGGTSPFKDFIPSLFGFESHDR